MAQLEVTQVPSLVVAHWRVASASPSALAAVPDAIVQHMSLTDDAFSAWSWHYDEQGGLASTAYLEERRELGPTAQVEVVELPLPHRPNVVHVERFHLLSSGAHASTAHRLAGLYVQARGRMVGAVHDRAATPQVTQLLRQIPTTGPADQLVENIAQASRFTFTLLEDDRHGQSAMAVRCPAVHAAAALSAIDSLRHFLAGW